MTTRQFMTKSSLQNTQDHSSAQVTYEPPPIMIKKGDEIRVMAMSSQKFSSSKKESRSP